MASGGFGTANGLLSATGILLNSTGEKIGTVIAERQDDNSWIYYDELTQEFNPYATTGNKISWENESYTIPSETPEEPNVLYYIREKVLNEPTNLTAAPSGKGNIKKYAYTDAQFQNEGNLGAADSSLHSLVKFDTDGVPSLNGERVESNATTLQSNETGAYGDLTVWEGNLFYPTRYPNTAAGKYVTSAKLVNIYTSTTYPDFEWMAVASNGGIYSLDREDLQVVLNGSTSGGRDIYQLDPAQKGQWLRFAYANGDKGNHSQTDVRMELTYEDGTVQTITLTNFIHQVGALSAHSIRDQEIIARNSDTNVWSKDGTDYPSTGVNAVTQGARNMQPIEYGRQPISFDAYLSGDIVSFSGVSGGNNDNYQYSIDNGINWQTGLSFNLSGLNSREILPKVKDSDGQMSCVKSISEWINCSTGAWSADLISPNTNDTEYDDGTGVRGWNIDYSTVIGGDHLESSNSALDWALNKVFQNTSYLYMGNTFTDTDTDCSAPLLPIIQNTIIGQEYTLAASITDYYLGAPTNDVNFSMRVVDTVTSSTLAEIDHTWGGNLSSSHPNEIESFVGTGNPIKIEIDTITDPISADWWGNTTYATLTATTQKKTAGTGWNTRISSGKGATVGVSEIIYSFSPMGSGNKGMIGVDKDYLGTSYSGGDYLFYVHSNTSFGIYENGSNKAPIGGSAYALGNNAKFEIKIATDGTARYYVNDTLRYLSATNAGVGSKYWASSFIYTTNLGIKNISWNGTEDITLPDATGHYAYIDNIRLFKGRFSDATHYAKSVGNDIFCRNIDGKATILFNKHSYSERKTIRPKFNLIKYGAWTENQGIALKYKINTGVWVTMLDHIGDFDAANKIYLSPFTYGKNIDLSVNDEIQYKIEITGNAVGNSGVYIREISETVVC